MTRRALASFLLSHVVPSPGHPAGPATVLGWAMDPSPGVWVTAAQPGCAVSLSLLRVCSVTATARDLEFGCSCCNFSLDTKEQRLLCKAPLPAASSPGLKALKRLLKVGPG